MSVVDGMCWHRIALFFRGIRAGLMMRKLLQSVRRARTSSGGQVGKCWPEIYRWNVRIDLRRLIERITGVPNDKVFLGLSPHGLHDAHSGL